MSKYDENWPEGSRGARVLHRGVLRAPFYERPSRASFMHASMPFDAKCSTRRRWRWRWRRLFAFETHRRTPYHPASLHLAGGLVFLFVHGLPRRWWYRRRAFTLPRPATPEISYFTRPRSVSSCKWYENRVSTSRGRGRRRGDPRWVVARSNALRNTEFHFPHVRWTELFHERWEKNPLGIPANYVFVTRWFLRMSIGREGKSEGQKNIYIYIYVSMWILNVASHEKDESSIVIHVLRKHEETSEEISPLEWDRRGEF